MSLDSVNSFLKSKEYSPVTLLVAGAAGGYTIKYIYKEILAPGDYYDRSYKFMWKTIRVVLRSYINKTIEKEAAGIGFPKVPAELYYGAEPLRALPENGWKPDVVIARAKEIASKLHRPYNNGFFSGTVYLATPTLTKVVNEVCSEFQWTNPLHVETFPGVRIMESQVISMVVKLYRGTPDTCGMVTSGGTESILMAMKCYRDWGRDKRWITEPEIVISVTAHPAFLKACQYFCIRPRIARIDKKTGRVDLTHVKRLINGNTVAIVGSAPNFCNGAVDDIPALARLALQYNVGLHVDCCLGSFIMPYVRDDLKARTGIEVDFAVPGVTSISCDTHKYGGAPKGTSVVMYANKELRRYQVYSVSSWPGGIYASPGLAGSRPGNVIAGTWAAMMYHGDDGYKKNAADIIKTVTRFADFIRSTPELEIYGSVDASVVCFKAKNEDKLDIFRVFQLMKEKGIEFNALQFPSAISVAFTLQHTFEGNIERIISIVKEAVEATAANPQKASGAAALYGSTQAISDRTIVDDVVKRYFDAFYDLK
eukprot:PhF_6_TR29299/c0_g1_i1/m.42958/K01634/SGPL1, DPL1; sphinganine-1-phosphate aldolase